MIGAGALLLRGLGPTGALVTRGLGSVQIIVTGITGQRRKHGGSGRREEPRAEELRVFFAHARLVRINGQEVPTLVEGKVRVNYSTDRFTVVSTLPRMSKRTTSVGATFKGRSRG